MDNAISDGFMADLDQKSAQALRRPRPAPLFPLGRIVATPGALDAMQERGRSPAGFLLMHQYGRWTGEESTLCTEDAESNGLAVLSGDRIFSSFTMDGTKDAKLWVITEADRSATTLLLPEEY